MFFLALVPGGVGLVWAPVAIWLGLGGNTWSAVFMVVWGGGVVGTIDNVLRPPLAGRGVKLDGITLFFGLVGGMAAFGLVGLFLGPIVLYALRELVAILRRRVRGRRNRLARMAVEGGVMRDDRARAGVWTLLGAVVLVRGLRRLRSDAAGASAAEHRRLSYRRSRLRRSVVLRPPHDQHAEHRSDGARGHPTHVVLRGALMHAVAGAVPDRPLLGSIRRASADRSRLACRPAAERDHDRGGVEGAGLSDRDARQVAPRRFCEPA